MTLRIYLAGPMTGIPDLNFPLFHAETARLRSLGYDVVNPAEIKCDPTAGWSYCMRRCIIELCSCDALAMLPGWERSKGARLERHIAQELGMLVLNAALLAKPPGHPWERFPA